jgi:hypothetical protein
MTKAKSYFDRVIEILKQEKKSMNVKEIMEKMDAFPGEETDRKYNLLEMFPYKINYVISALKKGLKQGLIKKIENPTAKTLYKDHFYCLSH